MPYRINRRRLLEGMALAPLAMNATLAHTRTALTSGDSPSLQAARAARPSLDHRALDRLGWNLASQAYTFRELTLFETIDVLNALGIRYIEMYPGQRFSPDNPARFDHNAPAGQVAELQRKLRSARVTPVNYGVVGLNNNEAEARKVYDFAKAMRLLTIVSEPPEDALPLLDRLSREYRIGLALHNHPRPSRYWNPNTVLEATRGLSQYVGACADTGHWYRSDLSPVEALDKLEGRIISLHFKDLNRQKQDVPWGTGECNVRAMMAELKRQGFRGVFSVEYESTSGAELVRNVARSIDYFSRVARELAPQSPPRRSAPLIPLFN
ncbi:MAG: sugar phosphate isomerase/epimerase [Armatimonadetes bacterium]|nr:sugar phosphate isomerase/epimerase [Armatimonadota bacterium]